MYNMFDPRARQMTSLTKPEWITIMRDYEKLSSAWSKEPTVQDAIDNMGGHNE